MRENWGACMSNAVCHCSRVAVAVFRIRDAGLQSLRVWGVGFWVESLGFMVYGVTSPGKFRFACRQRLP